MARKPRELKIKRIDKIAKLQKKLSVAKPKDEMTEAQVKAFEAKARANDRRFARSEYARHENEKIMNEREEDCTPLIIDYNGKPKLVLDPMAVWSLETPPFLDSDENMILTHMVKPAPQQLGVFDLETFSLSAGVVHHGVFLKFEDDDRVLDESDFKDVEFFYSLKELKDKLFGLLADVINNHEANPFLGKTAKVYAHNGQNFDFVGLAMSMGLDRNHDVEAEIRINGEIKKTIISIDTFSQKSKITFKTGRGGEYKLQLIDSAHLLPEKLKNLGGALAKGETPLQFKDPIAWINQKTRKNGERFKLSMNDIAPYLVIAHMKSIEECRFDLSEEAYEGLMLWRGSMDDREYSCADAVVLVNALKRYARKIRGFAEKLGDIMTPGLMSSIQPFSYNTISSAGFALSAAFWYHARLYIDESGEIQFKRYLTPDIKKYALIDRTVGSARIISDKQAENLMASGVPVQKHGIYTRGTRVEVEVNGVITKQPEMLLVEQPIFTSEFDNRFSRIAQSGSLTIVMQPMAYQTRKFDMNSSFPGVMAKGARKRTSTEGYVFRNHQGHQEVVGGKNDTLINALVGFEDPGNRCSAPTLPMIQFGIATRERMKNERGEDVIMWVVRGRQKILQMLQFRNGEFTCILPPSKDPFLNECPLIPLRTPGGGLDSRLINPQITRPTMLLIRGEYLAAYASHETENDEAMVVYLCEIKESDAREGEYKERHRSRHGPIVGVNCTRSREGHITVLGQPFMPHQRFMEMLFNTRLHEKNQAKEARKNGDEELAMQYMAESQMTKMLMNGGSYGSYAQNNRPEIDFNLASIEECVDVLTRIQGLDPQWQGMANGLSNMSSHLRLGVVHEDEANWKVTFVIIEKFKQLMASVEHDELETMRLKRDWITGIQRIFEHWAANQLTYFTTYRYKAITPGGGIERQKRGILVASEKTASHAIRPYPCAVLAKNAVALHEGQRSVYASPFNLCYSDTDSLDIETGRIIKKLSTQVMSLIGDEYKRRTGEEPRDYRKALEDMLSDEAYDGISAELPGNTKLIIDILKSSGLEISEKLGEWGIEKSIIEEGLIFNRDKESGGEQVDQGGKEYVPHLSYYFSTKVYMYTDTGGNVAQATVRSVPRINPIFPAVMKGFMIATPSVSDRRGLSPQSLHSVDLNDTKRVAFGRRSKPVLVPSLISRPRRRYPDAFSSEPFALDIPQEYEDAIMSGTPVVPSEMSRVIAKAFSLDKELSVIAGSSEALTHYINNSRIAGMTYATAQKKVAEDLRHSQDVLKLISELMEEKKASDVPVIYGMRDVEDKKGAAKASSESITFALNYLQSLPIGEEDKNNNKGEKDEKE